MFSEIFCIAENPRVCISGNRKSRHSLSNTAPLAVSKILKLCNVTEYGAVHEYPFKRTLIAVMMV